MHVNTRTLVKVGRATHMLDETGPVTIGRAPSAGIRVGSNDATVSREHLRLTFAAGLLHIDDTSMNGMYAPADDGSGWTRVGGCGVDLGRQLVKIGDNIVLTFIRQCWHNGEWVEFDPSSPPTQAL